MGARRAFGAAGSSRVATAANSACTASSEITLAAGSGRATNPASLGSVLSSPRRTARVSGACS